MTTQSRTSTAIGRLGEDAAAEYLLTEGYAIVERNYRYSHREIDIIAENENRLIFVEVKARTDNGRNLERYGRPSDAVTKRKQKLLSEAAFFYLRTHEAKKVPRLDVIEVYFYPSTDCKPPMIKRIHHIKNAFTALK